MPNPWPATKIKGTVSWASSHGIFSPATDNTKKVPNAQNNRNRMNLDVFNVSGININVMNANATKGRISSSERGSGFW